MLPCAPLGSEERVYLEILTAALLSVFPFRRGACHFVCRTLEGSGLKRYVEYSTVLGWILKERPIRVYRALETRVSRGEVISIRCDLRFVGRYNSIPAITFGLRFPVPGTEAMRMSYLEKT